MFESAVNIGTGFLFVWIYNEFQKQMHYLSVSSKLKQQLEEAKRIKQDHLGQIRKMLKKVEGDTTQQSCCIALSIKWPPRSTYLFSKTYQAVPISDKYFFQEDGFIKGAVGGQFQICDRNDKIKIDLRQCNIEQSTLSRSRQILKIRDDRQPGFQRVIFQLNPRSPFMLVGVISYNLATKTYTFLPSFLLNPLVNKDTLYNAQQFVNSKIRSAKFSIAVLITLAGLIFLYRKNSYKKLVSSAFSWIKSFFVEPRGIQQLIEVFSRPEDKLKCSCGKPLDIIYECGHLSICETCHKNARRKLCPICHKQSEKIQKVYT